MEDRSDGGLLLYNATGHATSLQRRAASFGKGERLIKKDFYRIAGRHLIYRDGTRFIATRHATSLQRRAASFGKWKWLIKIILVEQGDKERLWEWYA
jgi:hypothetical protein